MAVHLIDSNFDNQVRVPADILEDIFERNVVRRVGGNEVETRWQWTDANTGKVQTLISSRYSMADVDAIHFGQMRQRHVAEDVARRRGL